jgi:hypothetical protein
MKPTSGLELTTFRGDSFAKERLFNPFTGISPEGYGKNSVC